jgi:hypothetical protein
MKRYFFDLKESCPYKACIHFHEGKCWLDNKPISKWIKNCMNLHTGEQCMMRRQINEYLLEEMLRD